jgi:hypothetical protein
VEPAELAVLLSTDVNVLEAHAETARWRAFSTWAIDGWRRTLAAVEINDATTIAVAV